jgi:hypothetical protein
MVEPSAALAAFVMGVLSWYGMIRTGIERFNKDIHEIKGRKRSVRISTLDLELLDRDMERWRKLWLILHKDMGKDLHVILWGESAYVKIRRALMDMEAKAQKAHNIVNTWIRLAPEEQTQAEESNGNHAPAMADGLLTKSEKGPGLKGRLKRVVKGGQKFVFHMEWFFTQKNRFEGLMQDMAKLKTYVNQIAEEAWTEERGKTFDEKVIQNEGLWELLQPFAIDVRADLALMAQSLLCLDDDFHVELELNPFEIDQTMAMHPEKTRRSRQIPILLEAAAKKSVKVGFLMASAQQPHLLIRLVISKGVPVGANLPAIASHNNAYTAVHKIIHQQGHNDQEVDYRVTQRDQFSITKSTQFHEQNRSQRSNLRDLLSGPPIAPNAAHGAPINGHITPFNRARQDAYCKYKTIFELAQACFIFMQTSWLRNLCSCRLQLGELYNQRGCNYEYAVNVKSTFAHRPMGHSPAANPDADNANGQAQVLPPWCTNPAFWNWTSSPIRRVGILLVELTLDETVRDVTVDARGAITRVFLETGPPDGYGLHGLRTRITTLTEEEKDRAEHPRGTEYANAVRHCLEAELPEMSPTGLASGPDLEVILKRFYWNAIVP